MPLPNRLPEKAEFDEWLASPVTVALKHILQRWKRGRMEQWAAGEFLDLTDFATVTANARAIGECATIEAILDFDHEKFSGELKELEQE